MDELLDIAAERVERALHPESLGVFLLDDAAGHYTCVIPREGGPAVLRADFQPGAELCCSPAPRETETGGLMLPIVTKGNLLGILSLGPRLGDLPSDARTSGCSRPSPGSLLSRSRTRGWCAAWSRRSACGAS